MNLLENMDHELWESKNVIYCYTNKINGKRYVGQTVQKLRKRHNQHFSGEQLIDRKIKQYGVENFKLEILHFADTYSIDILERHYIHSLDTFVKNGKGYNVSSGGHNGNPFIGKTKEEMSGIFEKRSTPVVGVNLKTGDILRFGGAKEAERLTNKKFCNSKIILCCKGKRLTHKGHKWWYASDFDENNIDFSVEKKITNKEIVGINIITKEVLFFNSAREANRYSENFRYKNISLCLKGKSKTCGGYKWYYKEDYENLTDEEIKSITKKEPKKFVAVSIKDSNVKIHYNGIAQASRDGFISTSIYSCCAYNHNPIEFLKQHKIAHKSHKGYKWYYEEDCDRIEEIDNFVQKLENGKWNKNSLKGIVAISITNGEILFFENIRRVAEANFHTGNVHKCCRKEIKTCNGYKWYYEEDYNNMSEDDIKLEISLISSSVKSVVGVSLEDNKKIFYTSIRETIKDGFDSSSISRCCQYHSDPVIFFEKHKRHIKSHKGYRWYYEEDCDRIEEINIVVQRLEEETNKIKILFKNIIAVSVKDGKVLFFENSSQAIKEGFHSSAIHKCCRGELRTHKGYKWYYKEDYDNVSNNDIKLEVDMILNKGKSVVGVSVEDSDKKLFYDAIAHAAKDGFTTSPISSCCKGKRKTHKGYKWYYKEDYDKMITETN